MVNHVRFFSSKIHNSNVHIQMFICTFVRFLELRNQSIANSSGAFQNITGNNFRKKMINPQHFKAEMAKSNLSIESNSIPRRSEEKRRRRSEEIT